MSILLLRCVRVYSIACSLHAYHRIDQHDEVTSSIVGRRAISLGRFASAVSRRSRTCHQNAVRSSGLIILGLQSTKPKLVILFLTNYCWSLVYESQKYSDSIGLGLHLQSMQAKLQAIYQTQGCQFMQARIQYCFSWARSLVYASLLYPDSDQLKPCSVIAVQPVLVRLRGKKAERK